MLRRRSTQTHFLIALTSTWNKSSQGTFPFSGERNGARGRPRWWWTNKGGNDSRRDEDDHGSSVSPKLLVPLLPLSAVTPGGHGVTETATILPT